MSRKGVAGDWDKGESHPCVTRAVVVMNTTDYLHEGYRQLSDTKFYTKLHYDPTKNNVRKTLTQMKQKGLISEKNFPSTASSGKAGSCLPLVGSLQYRTLMNCMYWFPLPFQLPVMI